jgi:excisionase family DNA binding protein
MMSPFELESLADALADRVVERLAGRADAEALIDGLAVAELLGCSLATVERRTRCGDIPSIKVGRLRRYRRADVLAMNGKGGCDHA